MFSLDERRVIHGFCEYKMDKEKISDDLKPLRKAVSTITVSTSECERNFSAMNNILTAKRSSLNIPTVASLLLINLVRPPMNQFDPTKYVKSWLAKGRRSADETACPERKAGSDNNTY
jgi:hypothetical protein